MKCAFCEKDSLVMNMHQAWKLTNPPKYVWVCRSRVACRWRTLMNIFKPRWDR